MPFDSHTVRTLRGLAVLAFAFVLVVALEVFSRLLLEGSVDEGPRRLVRVDIPVGADIPDISRLLHEKNLIDHPIIFRYAVRLMGADTRIQAGSISLASGQSMFELIQALSHAKSVGVPVVIREGLTSMDIAGILQHSIGADSAEFMAVVRDTVLIRELKLSAPTLEGYLFPDTYLLATGSDLRRIARRMVANFRSHLPKDAEARSQSLGLSLHQALTLASIVEWETMLNSEARTIASVYLNRIKRGMLLQADPTVSYALGKGPSRLYFSDLKVDSPYNTYRYAGLPPGPINNPGKFSLEATLTPENTAYLYFVARGDGTHAFTSTLSDHLDAKQQLDRLRRESRTTDSLTSING